jgi:hypothetical protein
MALGFGLTSVMGNREEKLRKMNHWFTLPRTYKEKKISTLFLHLFFHNIG